MTVLPTCKRLLSLGAVSSALACGSDPTGPTGPPTPGAPPTVSATPTPSTGNVPFQFRLRVTVGGDSLARLIVLLEGREDTIAPLTQIIFDHFDSVHAVGSQSARLIVQSAAGRADTADVTLTGTNPSPVLAAPTLSSDSTEVTDSVLLTVTASDNRGGVSLITVWDGAVDSVFSAGAALSRGRWLRRLTPGTAQVTIRARDADGAVVADSVDLRFFVIGPSADLKVPVRADTAPLVVQASVILHRATMPYDSVRVTLSNGTTKLFTGLARADTVQVQDTLSEVGVTQVTARWYHPSTAGELQDSVEVLLAPNQSPVGSFEALVDTVLESMPATYRLAFTDDRGVRLARLFRRTGDSRELLQVVPLGDALSDTVMIAQVLTSRVSDTVEAELEDRDGATVVLRAAPVYTDGRPRVQSAVFSVKRSLYRLGVPLQLAMQVDDEGSITCSATSSLGTTASGGMTLPIPVRNPTAAEDSLQVTAQVICTDNRGQGGAQSSDTATVLHADVGRIVLIDATTLSRIDQRLVVNGDSLASIGQEVGLGFRGVSTISVKDADSKWIVLVKGDSIARYDANGVVRMPFADGDVDTLYVIPNTPVGIEAAKDASRLITFDTAGRYVTRYTSTVDISEVPGIQVAADFRDYDHFGRDRFRPDSATIAQFVAAHDRLLASVAPLLPRSRRVALVQVDSGVPATVKFAWDSILGGMNVYGPGFATTLFQSWRGIVVIDTTGWFPCPREFVALGPHWRGLGYDDPQWYDPVSLLVSNKGGASREFFERYFSFESCTLRDAGKAVFVIQALFGNRNIDLP